MTEDNPDPQNASESVPEAAIEQVSEAPSVPTEEEEKVPLKVLLEQKKKTKQLKEELEFYKKQAEAKPPEEDYSRYESVTREELGKTQFETIRHIQESDWAKNNPEKVQVVEQELEDFLKARPNLAPAIQNSTNRLQEAWDLMSALSPKQRAKSQAAPKKEAPMSPGTVPKAAAMNEAVDLMTMNDNDFRAWRQSKARRR